MMKHFLAILVLFLCSSAWTQIRFDELIYDFGIIREDGKPVSHQFTIHNDFDKPLEIQQIQPSCGCTVVDYSQLSIRAGKSENITITYDPKGRPGYFMKPIELHFLMDGKRLKRDVAIKGFVGSSSSKPFRSAENQQFKIEIAPLHHQAKYPEKWNVHFHPRFQSFINDLSFVIDQYNFVELIVEYNPKDTSAQWKQGYQTFKNRVIEELDKRNYPKVSIGFAKKIADSRDNKSPYIHLNFYPKTYTNFSLKESIITDLTPVPLNLAPVGTKQHMIHYSDIDIQEKKYSDEASYQRFVKRCVRNYISHGEIHLGVTLFSNTQTELKKVNKLSKNLKKDLVKQGLEEEHIFFAETDTLKEDLAVVRIAEYLPGAPIDTTPTIDTLPFYELFSSTGDQDYTEYEGHVVQNLPAYFQQLKNYVRRVDTTDAHFIHMMDKVIEEIKNGRKIEFVMESSASKAPAEINVDNHYVARLRAKESIDIMKVYLKNRGLLDEDIHFKESIPLVSGPEYDLRHYLIQYYYYFQYLKVIPIYRVEEKSFNIPPYKVHLMGNSIDLMDEAAIFQRFLDKIAQQIQDQGYIKLIIESSSSKVPPGRKIGKHEHLSYHRAQEAKNKIYDGIRKRGFNPSKVIIVEERILVQGPEFERGMDPHDEKFTPYQYIKVLTSDLLIEK